MCIKNLPTQTLIAPSDSQVDSSIHGKTWFQAPIQPETHDFIISTRISKLSLLFNLLATKYDVLKERLPNVVSASVSHDIKNLLPDPPALSYRNGKKSSRDKERY